MARDNGDEYFMFRPVYVVLFVLSMLITVFLTVRSVASKGFWAFMLESLKYFCWSGGLLVAVIVATYLAFRAVVALVRLRHTEKVNVFVSYQHEHEAAAAAVAEGVRGGGVNVSFIPFRPREEEHNQVLDEVREGLDAADVVLVITSEEKGFYHSEIFAAAMTGKGIILLEGAEEFHLPPTAYKGYPELSIKELEGRRYEPLVQLIHYAAGSRTAVDYARRAAQSETAVLAGVVFLVLGLTSAGFVVTLVAQFLLLLTPLVFGQEWAVPTLAASENVISLVIVVVLACAMFAFLIKDFRENNRVKNVIRDRIRRKELANDVLRELLGDRNLGREIIPCLWKPQLDDAAPGDVPAQTRQ